MRARRLLFLLVCTCLSAITGFAQPSKTEKQPSRLYQIKRLTEINGQGRHQFGFIDRTGKVVIGFDLLPTSTWYVGDFHEDRALIYLRGATPTDTTIGYIDSRGKIVIAAKFTYARDFSEGLAYVEGEGLRGYINRDGQVVFTLDSVASAFTENHLGRLSGKDFHEGLAAVGTGLWSKGPYDRDESTYGNTLWGYINRDGKLVIKPEYRFADDFSEGRAGVAVGRGYGFIDKEGRMVVSPRFVPKRGEPHAFGIAGTSRFHEGVAVVREEEYGAYGYIDKAGNYLFPPRFRRASDFSDGVAWAAEIDPTTKGIVRTGWINKAGEWVRTLEHGGNEWSGRNFSEGLAAFSSLINDKGELRWGYIDRRGNQIIRPVFHAAEDFVDGVAHVQIETSVHAYIDKTGRIIWKPY